MSAGDDARTNVGVVVLSMGNRPAELRRALESVLRQTGVSRDVIVVGNGWEPEDLPEGVRGLGLPDNVGVPEGRNIGAAAVAGDVLLFLDDDLVLPDDGTFAGVVADFRADERLAAVQLRAVEPGTGATARRHVPRLDVRDPERPGDVAWFWEGCSFLRRWMFEEVGGWPGHFVYGHEGVEVAWRLVDAGYRIHYAADRTVENPPAAPFRGPQHQFMNARNRVWVARRNLPHPVLEAYLLVWFVLTLARARRGELRSMLRGFATGLRTPAGERRTISWRGVWRLTRLGRPPVV